MKILNLFRSIGFALIIIQGVFILNAVWQLRSGDFTQAGQGMGAWSDGVLYGRLSQNLMGELREKGIPRNRIDRLLPVSLVYLSLRLTEGVKAFTGVEVIQRYRIANVVVLFLAICMFGNIAKKLSWSTEAFYIACAACFFNFAFLKFPFYYATLTDNFALFLSVASLLAYLYQRTLLLSILTLMAAFSWSSSLLTNFALLLFPFRSYENYPSSPSNGKRLAVVMSLITFILLCKTQNPFRYHWSDGKIHLELLGIYFVFISFYFFAWSHLLSFSFRQVIKQFNLGGGASVVLIYCLSQIITILLASEFGRAPFGVSDLKDILLRAIFGNGIRDWGSFYVPHVVYFGPGILLMMMFWPELVKSSHRLGLGFVAVLSIFLFCSPDSESRHLLYGLPFFAVALGTCLNEKTFPQKVSYVFLVFCIFTSRAWLPIGNELESRYFSNFGPWVTDYYYRLELALTIFFGGGLYLGIKTLHWKNSKPIKLTY